MKYMFMALLLILASGLIGAQDDQPGDFEPNAALQAHLNELESFVTELRGLVIQSPLDRRFPDREGVVDYVLSVLSDPRQRQLIEGSRWFYAAFGFMSPEVDLYEVYLDLLASQVGGFYDTETKSMNTLLIGGGTPGDELPLLEQILYVHEFVHALQDSNFDLEAFLGDEDALALEPDRAQALVSVVEGEATLIMSRYQTQLIESNPLAALAMLGQLSTGNFDIPAGTPAILTDELLSPYMDGMVFVNYVLSDGGWEAVDALYTDPPVSTEQILNPDKFFAGELPIEVTLNPSESAMGDNWTQLYDRTLGEFYLRKYLDLNLLVSDAMRAAQGWGGDRYHVYYDADALQTAFVMKLVWDDTVEAEEFNGYYGEFLADRFEGVAESDGCYAGDAESICWAVIDDVTSVISTAPTLETAQALLNTQR